MAKVLSIDQLRLERERMKSEARRVVLTNGCFDLLHPGHVRFLAEAKSLGDCLMVAINSDRSVREIKGPDRPLLNENDRAEVLAALSCVDFLTIFDESTPLRIISILLPDILVKGGDWSLDQIVGRAEVEAAGGRVISLPYSDGYSSSMLIERIRSK
jgi:D-glycero-beta-D-manno-heptose 1-phosphate adenylyltransferase